MEYDSFCKWRCYSLHKTSMKTLMFIPLLCILLAPDAMPMLIEIDQITLKGEYVDAAGHPGIPHEPLPSDITVWEESIAIDDPLGLPSYGYSLYIQNTTGMLLQSGPYTSPSPNLGYEWIIDGDRVAWTLQGSDAERWASYNVLALGALFYGDFSDLGMSSFTAAFGAEFFVVYAPSLLSDPIGGEPDWSTAALDISLSIITFDLLQFWSADDLSFENLLGDCAVPESNISVTVYANGIGIAQDWSYPGCNDEEVYTEHFWIQVPEPTTLLLLGWGAFVLRRKR